ncbi:MAG: hypothetical protein ACOVOR_04990 [Rhabdochlamydiaceae bacterium]
MSFIVSGLYGSLKDLGSELKSVDLNHQPNWTMVAKKVGVVSFFSIAVYLTFIVVTNKGFSCTKRLIVWTQITSMIAQLGSDEKHLKSTQDLLSIDPNNKPVIVEYCQKYQTTFKILSLVTLFTFNWSLLNRWTMSIARLSMLVI